MIETVKHLAYILKCKTSPRELRTICADLSHPDHINDSKYYRKKVEIKIKAGKPKERILYPSKGRLKLIQERIKSNILSKIVLPDFVQGGVKGRSNLTNALIHKGKRYKFTTDIRKFFPSVTSEMVYKMLLDYKFSPDVARTLTLLCTYKGMLPQGTPTSTHIANLVFLPLDWEIQKNFPLPNMFYSRFVDDVTISSNNDFKAFVQSILKTITDSSFRISHQKTHYNGISDITGIDVAYNGLRPNKKFLDKLNEENQTENQKNGRLTYFNRVMAANQQ